jgi:hypothetical protein
MNTQNLILKGGLLFLAAVLSVSAQTRSDYTTSYTHSTYGAVAGDKELTLGGSGVSSKDFDNSSGGVNASLGYYFTDTLEGVIRQSVSYTNPETSGGADWSGSTFGALDLHILPRGGFRPFVGINFGGFYGDNVSDTLAAGLEAGAKFYVQPKTFIFALADYAWVFHNSHQASENFDDGAFQWTVGIGFNF